MRPKLLIVLLVLGCMRAAVPPAMAQTAPPAPSDTTAAKPDTAAVKPDSAAVAPVVPPPAAATPPPAPASTPTPASTPPPATKAVAAPATASQPSRIYYGGTVTLSFGSTTRIGIFPMVGYKLTPKISGGVEAGYEWVDYGSESSHNYGASVFGRYRMGRNLYAHGEYQAVNYEIYTGPNSSSREWVPFLLLGGGYYRMISPRTSVYAEVLFDVLQDDRSPYDNWQPVVSVGVGVGF
jgi:hypothetical protein